MSKQEFLEVLRRKLTGRLSASEVEENIRYYDTYIDQAAMSGKGVDEVLEELGDPDLIARTILDARGAGGSDRVYTASESRRAEDDGCGEDSQMHTTWKVRQISGWTVWLVLILALVIILAVVVPVFVWVVKLVVPVILVLAALVFIRDHFGSGRS